MSIHNFTISPIDSAKGGTLETFGDIICLPNDLSPPEKRSTLASGWCMYNVLSKRQETNKGYYDYRNVLHVLRQITLCGELIFTTISMVEGLRTIVGLNNVRINRRRVT